VEKKGEPVTIGHKRKLLLKLTSPNKAKYPNHRFLVRYTTKQKKRKKGRKNNSFRRSENLLANVVLSVINLLRDKEIEITAILFRKQTRLPPQETNPSDRMKD
jgi:hypothetical protein